MSDRNDTNLDTNCDTNLDTNMYTTNILNKQDMATVYYLGGLKNDLSNLWNSVLNIKNLASSCESADLNIENAAKYAGGNILEYSFTLDTNYDINDIVTNIDDIKGDYIQISQALGGQGAIFAIDSIDTNNNTLTLTQIYGGLNYYESSDTNYDSNELLVTIQTNGTLDLTNFTFEIITVGTTDINIARATLLGKYWAEETVKYLRKVNGASTSGTYVQQLRENQALDIATTNWTYGLKDCLQSLMLSMTDTEPDIYDESGTQVKVVDDTSLDAYPYRLSSASVAPYMFNAADGRTQVGIMMKVKALADYADFLQNNARAWNMLLANLTYGPTTMFNVNEVSKFIDAITILSNRINAFCSEIDILYVQVRSGTYSVQTNSALLQVSYCLVRDAVDSTETVLNALRIRLIA